MIARKREFVKFELGYLILSIALGMVFGSVLLWQGVGRQLSFIAALVLSGFIIAMALLLGFIDYRDDRKQIEEVLPQHWHVPKELLWSLCKLGFFDDKRGNRIKKSFTHGEFLQWLIDNHMEIIELSYKDAGDRIEITQKDLVKIMPAGKELRGVDIFLLAYEQSVNDRCDHVYGLTIGIVPIQILLMQIIQTQSADSTVFKMIKPKSSFFTKGEIEAQDFNTIFVRVS